MDYINVNQLSITDKKIIKKITLPLCVEEVWTLWSTNEGTKRLFGTETFIEMTPFGKYEIYFDSTAPEGLRGSETCRVLSFIPREMLSFTWNAPPNHEEIRNHVYKTWVVINMKPIQEQSTEVELIHLGWPEGEKWDAVYAYFERAWSIVFEGMGQLVTSEY